MGGVSGKLWSRVVFRPWFSVCRVGWFPLGQMGVGVPGAIRHGRAPCLVTGDQGRNQLYDSRIRAWRTTPSHQLGDVCCFVCCCFLLLVVFLVDVVVALF